jgi:hypothetical protein
VSCTIVSANASYALYPCASRCADARSSRVATSRRMRACKAIELIRPNGDLARHVNIRDFGNARCGRTVRHGSAQLPVLVAHSISSTRRRGSTTEAVEYRHGVAVRSAVGYPKPVDPYAPRLLRPKSPTSGRARSKKSARGVNACNGGHSARAHGSAPIAAVVWFERAVASDVSRVVKRI